MHWCHRRQMFQQIQAEVYEPRASAKSLLVWATEVTNTYAVGVRGSQSCVMTIDWEVVELVFHDGLTNAQKYGDPKSKPWVEVQIDETTTQLVVNGCNVAHPDDAEMTDEVATIIVQGGKGGSHQSGIQAVDDAISACGSIPVLGSSRSRPMGSPREQLQERTFVCCHQIKQIKNK